MDDPNDIVAKARSSEWGFIDFSRGRVLFMRLNSEQVVLIEPSGGYYFPFHERTRCVPMPDAKTLASALAGAPPEHLDAIAAFTCEPRTMREIEAQFVGVEAWRLRQLGLLTDVGRKQRRIISQWAGYDLHRLVDHIFRLAASGTRNNNSP